MTPHRERSLIATRPQRNTGVRITARLRDTGRRPPPPGPPPYPRPAAAGLPFSSHSHYNGAIVFVATYDVRAKHKDNSENNYDTPAEVASYKSNAASHTLLPRHSILREPLQ
ncbi:hypothetical protein EVAR_16532_1 [Eumeta japonica]|uniref:Uncharacterized protein n=1 Tax=Eumeta variegata TaxID=151549 RepID=A0A4C1U306_EUMVA|nr:hypothetical protein EVAR_16532_1 [Eumeta japonica]